jgi:hypothetical protein
LLAIASNHTVFSTKMRLCNNILLLLFAVNVYGETIPAGHALFCGQIPAGQSSITHRYPDNRNQGCYKSDSNWSNGYCLETCDQGK